MSRARDSWSDTTSNSYFDDVLEISCKLLYQHCSASGDLVRKEDSCAGGQNTY